MVWQALHGLLGRVGWLAMVRETKRLIDQRVPNHISHALTSRHSCVMKFHSFKIIIQIFILGVGQTEI